MRHASCAEPDLRHLVCQQAFWARLGRTSSQEELRRMGGVLHACGTVDGGVGEALRRAAEGFAAECVPWGEHQAGFAKGATVSDTMVPLISEDGDAGGLASSGTSDTHSDSEATLADTLLPCPRLWALMPGFGGRLGFAVWMFLAAVALATKLFMMGTAIFGKPDIANNKLRDSRISWTGQVCNEASDAAAFAMCIQILVGLRRFIHSRRLREALERERRLESWYELVHFASRASCIAWAVFVVLTINTVFWNLTTDSLHDIRGWFEQNYGSTRADNFGVCLDTFAWVIFNLLIASWVAVFGVMWKLSMLELHRICDRIRAGGGDIEWTALTDDYTALCARLERLWGPGGMAPTLAAALAALLLSSMFSLSMGMTVERTSLVVYNMMWGTVTGGLAVGSVLLMAKLQSKCTSPRWSKHSILNLAVRVSGAVPAEQRFGHMIFKECVLRNPTSVDLGFLGHVTMPLAMTLVRIFVVSVPTIATVAAAKAANPFA